MESNPSYIKSSTSKAKALFKENSYQIIISCMVQFLNAVPALKISPVRLAVAFKEMLVGMSFIPHL